MLINNHQLTESQLIELSKLLLDCQTVDGGLPAIYHELLIQKRDSATNWFYYENDKLLGFLTVYFFFEDACEVNLLVDPNHRQRGISLQLLKSALPLLKHRNMIKLIFSCSPFFPSEWLTTKDLSYQHSEYKMERNSDEALLIANPSLTLREASLSDMRMLCSIDAVCFNEKHTNMPLRFTYLLNQTDYMILLAKQDNFIIGKAHIRWQEEGVLLSDIAILPAYQRKGFGSELLSHCINQALSMGKNKLGLDVEASNRNALNLYLRHGFNIINTYDFWAMMVEDLEQAL